MEYRQFCEHVSHAVDKHRYDKLKLEEQEVQTRTKLVQLQLSELTKNKMDIKTFQAPVAWEPQLTQQFPQTPRPPGVMTSPVVIYTQGNGSQQERGRGAPGQFHQRRRVQQNQGTPGLCWGCNQPGHMRRNCRANP